MSNKFKLKKQTQNYPYQRKYKKEILTCGHINLFQETIPVDIRLISFNEFGVWIGYKTVKQ